MTNIFKSYDEDEADLPSKPNLQTKIQAQEEPLLTTEFTVQRSLKSLKFAISGAFILSLAALIGAGVLYQSFRAEKSQRQAIETGQKEVLANAITLEDQVTQYKTVIERMREQISNYAKERKDFRQEFERNQVETANLRKKVQALEDRNRKIQGETERIRKELNMTEGELLTTQAELTSKSTDLSAARSELAAAETTLEQTVVDQPKHPQILSVNRKYNFAVVNLGKADGVRIGNKLNVFRDGKPIALLQVEKLYDSFTAAAIVKETRDEVIKQGDAIRLGS